MIKQNYLAQLYLSLRTNAHCIWWLSGSRNLKSYVLLLPKFPTLR